MVGHPRAWARFWQARDPAHGTGSSATLLVRSTEYAPRSVQDLDGRAPAALVSGERAAAPPRATQWSSPTAHVAPIRDRQHQSLGCG